MWDSFLGSLQSIRSYRIIIHFYGFFFQTEELDEIKKKDGEDEEEEEEEYDPWNVTMIEDNSKPWKGTMIQLRRSMYNYVSHSMLVKIKTSSRENLVSRCVLVNLSYDRSIKLWLWYLDQFSPLSSKYATGYQKLSPLQPA